MITEEVARSKERILSIMRVKGPCLPVQIAKELNTSTLFASAFLSELKTEDKIKISNMRVGSSPLYYLPGQESLLEKFIEHLNQREKEAFFLLKKAKVFEDELQEPVVRVALRAIKDFAIPIKININENSKLFWKYFSVSDGEASNIVSNIISPKKEEIEGKTELKKTAESEKVKEKKERKIKKKKIKKAEPSEFSKNVKDYLSAKDIEIIEVFSEKKKELSAKVRLDTLFGKQEYFLIAKDKKVVNDNDLTLTLQKANSERMPSILMARGELNNKAKEYIRQWSNLIKFEKLRF